MAAPIISVEHLSKRYLVGHLAAGARDDRFPNLREVLERSLRSSLRKAAEVLRGRQVIQGDAIEELWALKDVDFQVQEGEVLGIIGRNGAGKSTLLKILSRITEPTSGRVTLRGRLASLLEVGTGFHPELTGRENIYLNGAILGMSRAEIRKKFEEIVAFAEVEKFLDTPVKRYSSGMYVRLAFAVAAHLEPEILIVDEVLAVGDYNFQKKCLGKMKEASETDGRTVLFVSHNLNAIESLSSRCIMLASGRIAAVGAASETVAAYLGEAASKAALRLRFLRQKLEDKKAVVESVELSGSDREDANEKGIFGFSDQLCLEIQYRLLTEISGAHCGVELHAGDQVILISFDTDRDPDLLNSRAAGVYRAVLQLPSELLKPGRYFVNVTLGIPQGEIIDQIVRAVEFEVVLRDDYSAFISYATHRRGLVAYNTRWKTTRLNSAESFHRLQSASVPKR
jgi:lipopolysaccharide transport system ATP-binding protein